MTRSYNSRSRTAAGRFARLSAFAFALGALVSCNSAPKSAGSSPVLQKNSSYSAELLSNHVPDGSLVLVNVSFTQPFSGKLEAQFEDRKFPLYPLEDSETGIRTFQGAFGVPHSHKPGDASVRILPEGMQATDLKFEVVDGNYKSEILKVEARKVKPNKKDMKRILREVPEINAAVHSETPKRYWSGPFILPVQSVITDEFGIKRLYNGTLKSYHGGLDFRAPVGTQIYAAGAGKVALAKDLFFSGKTVIIDHGYGLVTMYFHMSRILVKKGQFVTAKQLLGLSGATGRVTGPHVHWQADIHQVKINPMDLVQELK